MDEDDNEDDFADIIAKVKEGWENGDDTLKLLIANDEAFGFSGNDHKRNQGIAKGSTVNESCIAGLTQSTAADSNSRLITVRIFFGGFVGEQITPIISALGYFTNLSIEYMYVKDVKDKVWSPRDLVDWLLGADVHIIPCHPHQGIIYQLRWDCDLLKTQLQRLAAHRGFPSGVNLECPIFLQDKFEYIRVMDTWSIPTVRIDFNAELYSSQIFADKVLR